ncbi:uncharacterized protein LOC128670152 [Plodia interpunctella]|uniref:uncharacterized protein LOC128670152 n=1 Tax=Plodia interpunctella TaxID=58824 RepID=UPI002367E349|nr:uncharacterized protein LOC128670152 [Plodia interpunctella]
MVSSRHATLVIYHNMFICIVVSLLLPIVNEGAGETAYRSRSYPTEGKRLTREYHLRQGALRGFIMKPGPHYNLQPVEVFLGIPYAAPPVGIFRFMPPASAPPWPGVKIADKFAPVCPQSLPPVRKGNPPAPGRQAYMQRLIPFLTNESEDCLYLNIYVPFRDHERAKKMPVLVFIHGDSFEWGSGNPYDGSILASYGNIIVITVNFRLGILGFLKPSLTDHAYGNNGLLDQLAALQWIKENIEDLGGDSSSVTVMGHGRGAACASYLMLSPISYGLFHRAILMSGTALSDWAMTKDPGRYTFQVAQSLKCNPTSKNMMACLQNKPLAEIKSVQILARQFEVPLGPIVAGSFIPSEPVETMASFPNLLSKYQVLSGVTELESYHDFGAMELELGMLETQRDDLITKYAEIVLGGDGKELMKEILRQYLPSKLDPQRWGVNENRDVILNIFSDARTLAPVISFADYQSKANRQSYFYVFGHNSISTEYAALNKSVNGEELPYVLGIPLGGANTHFHTEYTPKEKLLSEVMMRLWTNFVKIGTPNTQSVNKYYTLDSKSWHQYNVEWPEYDVSHQSYLKIDIPPYISSLYRSNFTKFWLDTLPKKTRRTFIDPMFEPPTPKPKPTRRDPDPIQKLIHFRENHASRGAAPSISYGRVRPYSPPEPQPDPDIRFREISSIESPSRAIPNHMEKLYTTTIKPKLFPIAMKPPIPVKTSSATMTLIISLGVLFLAVNVGICAILYIKKRRLRLRERVVENPRPPRAEIGEVDVIGQKSSKDDKSALQTFKNGCNVLKSMSLTKIRRNSKKSKKKSEICKTPKSDDSGGFRERFQLRRHLSTSTLDAHTKVRDWITNEVMHRCSPGILRKSNSDLNNDKHLTIVKPFTRSEELLSETKRSKRDVKDIKEKNNQKSNSRKSDGTKTRTSEKTTSTSALDSHSSIGSHKNSTTSLRRTGHSTDSLKSKGTESIKSRKVSVAIDATPAARTNSILRQEPIEITKSLDYSDQRHSNTENKLQRSKTEQDIKAEKEITTENKETKTYTNVVTLSVQQEKPLKIYHKHSTSDPVTDVNYDKLIKEKMENQTLDILPPVTFRNDINVTSRDEKIQTEPLTAAEALLTIQRRNFPKVLPDLPKAQKRLSLQPNSLQTFRGFGSIDHQVERPKIPPQPPPRTTTLERRLAYKNTKPLSSFDPTIINKITETDTLNKNYENINTLYSQLETTSDISKSFDKIEYIDKPESIILTQRDRDYPKVIIASSTTPLSDPKIIIKPTPSKIELPSNIPRVRLPDDFHSQAGSVTSFSSFCSEDDDDDTGDELDDIAEDKLLQELVGGVESPTDMTQILDTKGPDSVYGKKLEIVPVKLNPGYISPKNKEDYVCVTDLHLPDVTDLEKTAQIKPNFGLNKLQHRTESIHRPPEKAVKVKQKRSMKPSSLLNRSNRSSKRSSDKSKSSSSTLDYSNSGSSNDTETSTGTVRKVEVK